MRIYSSFKEAVKETERELVEMGTHIHPQTMQDKEVADNKAYETVELQGYGYVITSHVNRDQDFKELGGDMDYAESEFRERVHQMHLNPGLAWKKRESVWREFLERAGRFAYTYNERLRDQLCLVTYELATKPATRQGVVTVYDKHHDLSNLGGVRRIPCSMHYQFLRRKREDKEFLDCIYVMRSCDYYTHYIYDIWFAMRLTQYLATCIGQEVLPGRLTHFVGSLHAYHKDYSTKGVF